MIGMGERERERKGLFEELRRYRARDDGKGFTGNHQENIMFQYEEGG